MIGEVIASRYRVDSQIGVGGMGIVYRAHDLKLRRDVALKVIAPGLMEDEEARARFLQEAQALAGLSHPNIVTVFDLSEDPETNVVFIVMELLNGQPLRKRITDPSRPSFFDMAIQVCRALECAHSHGFLHRDIKPENIFVCADGSIKLMDFGLARLVDSAAVSTSGMVTGTIAYMSPEQLRGGVVDPRADLYSVGVLFYEYLSGFTPFTSDNPGTLLLKHLTEPAPSLRVLIPAVSPELDGLIQCLLAKDPADRYPSAMVLRDALERIRSGANVVAAPQTNGPVMRATTSIPLAPPRPKRPQYSATRQIPGKKQQDRVLVAVFCVVLLGAIVAFAFGETLQRMLLGNPAQTNKTTLAKKHRPHKTKHVQSSASRRSHRQRRTAGSKDMDRPAANETSEEAGTAVENASDGASKDPDEAVDSKPDSGDENSAGENKGDAEPNG